MYPLLECQMTFGKVCIKGKKAKHTWYLTMNAKCCNIIWCHKLLQSPNLTVLRWGYVKDYMYVPPDTTTIIDLKAHITATITSIDTDMLRMVWQELH